MSVSNREVYATQPMPLRDQLSHLLKNRPKESVEGEIAAVVVPDTNLLEAGEIAADVYKILEGRTYDTIVVVAPSHTGDFGRIHICSVDTYRTAFGELQVNDQVRNELCDEDDDIFLDNRGHFHIEGVDVQLPFLQTVLPETFDIVPIVMGDQSPDFCRELGHAIGEIMHNRRVLLVATADVLNAGKEELTRFRAYFEAGDVGRLMALVNSDAVRIEGRGPLLVALIAALHRRCNRIRILDMQIPESGDPGFFGAILWRS